MRARSRLFLLLMEMAVMLLVFAVCAAVCLRLFAGAGETAEKADDLARAAAWAQSAAEVYKAAKGEAAEAAVLLGAAGTEEGFALYFDGGWERTGEKDAVYALTLASDGGLAEIAVAKGGETLFSLEARAVAYG